jgi:hypothetical protein
VFNRNKFVALLTRFHESHVQTNFQFLGNHVNSFFALLLTTP